MRRLAPALLAAFTAVAIAGCMATPPTDVSVKTYKVNGRSSNALERSLRLHGPKVPGVRGRAFAAVETTFLHSFAPRQEGGRCSYNTNGQFGLKSEVTLPEWTHRDSAEPDLQAKWAVLSQYAVVHEAGHIKISQKYAKRLEAAYRGASAPTCAELEAKIERAVAPIAADHARAQTEFDATDGPRFRSYLRRRGYTIG